MIKFIAGILSMILLMFSHTAFAMNMSSMNKVGGVFRLPDGGIVINIALSNHGKIDEQRQRVESKWR